MTGGVAGTVTPGRKVASTAPLGSVAWSGGMATCMPDSSSSLSLRLGSGISISDFMVLIYLPDTVQLEIEECKENIAVPFSSRGGMR